MRRWFAIGIALVIVGALSFSSMTLAQQPAARTNDAAVIKVNPASKARIEISEKNWDFGSIPKGSIVAHAYKIKNTGTDTLQITNVKPTCGCTLAPLSSNSIAPGQEADLTANFNSEKFNGRVNKAINIDCSDPIQPYIKVLFSAIINNPLLTVTPEPAEVDFGAVKIGKSSQKTITIVNGEDKAIKLKIIEQGKSIKAQAPATSIPAHGKAEITLDLAPQASPLAIQESVTIEAVDVPNSRITIPCKASITN
jgi:hypothetical protein